MNNIKQNIEISKQNIDAFDAYLRALKLKKDTSEGRLKLPYFLLDLTETRLDETDILIEHQILIKSKTRAKKINKKQSFTLTAKEKSRPKSRSKSYGRDL